MVESCAAGVGAPLQHLRIVGAGEGCYAGGCGQGGDCFCLEWGDEAGHAGGDGDCSAGEDVPGGTRDWDGRRSHFARESHRYFAGRICDDQPAPINNGAVIVQRAAGPVVGVCRWIVTMDVTGIDGAAPGMRSFSWRWNHGCEIAARVATISYKCLQHQRALPRVYRMNQIFDRIGPVIRSSKAPASVLDAGAHASALGPSEFREWLRQMVRLGVD